MSNWQKCSFTVDSELLRELGERLVGRQYIALAELVKNSFDADATRVEIRIQDDCIEVADNGHGMTRDDFLGRWMRVGSTHKVKEETSPELKRPLTGSKGVGRLAVQFLASDLELHSVPKNTRVQPDASPDELIARVDWNQAVQARELVDAVAQYNLQSSPITRFPLNRSHGTIVRLIGLKHDWSSQEFEALAREVWFLQPPFRSLPGALSGESGGFEVELFASDPEVVDRFRTHMTRILGLYRSRIVGRLLPCEQVQSRSGQRRVRLSLQLENQTVQPYEFPVPVRGGGPCYIDSLEFEIRIFTLRYRQPHGIQVQQARDYMSQWGGVHIYDAGFRIPYAGPDADWLRLEFDHAHRLTKSQLLPDELHVHQGLNHLPTNSRVLGVVHIDTTREARIADQNPGEAGQHLQIQVSRDRLVGNAAFYQLRDAVRFALDFYALRMAALRLEEEAARQDVEEPTSTVEGVWQVLEQHANDIPKPVVGQIRTELKKTMDAVREQSNWTRRQSGLLGAMATMGATALAFDHQFNQQLNVLESHMTALEHAVSIHTDLTDALEPTTERIRTWIRDVRATRTIFSPVADERNRTAIHRFRARPLIAEMAGSLKTILRGVEVSVLDVDHDLILPKASYPVWMAIFHNVLMNASNAMLDCDYKFIAISSYAVGPRRVVRIQDTGVGINLNEAEELFKPLQRGIEISKERHSQGYGGTGLGLAIVRMLAKDIKANVRFTEPKEPFKTCFELTWDEKS